VSNQLPSTQSFSFPHSFCQIEAYLGRELRPREWFCVVVLLHPVVQPSCPEFLWTERHKVFFLSPVFVSFASRLLLSGTLSVWARNDQDFSKRRLAFVRLGQTPPPRTNTFFLLDETVPFGQPSPPTRDFFRRRSVGISMFASARVSVPLGSLPP